MNKQSLTAGILNCSWVSDGIIQNEDGSFSKVFRCEPLSSGMLEEAFDGPMADHFFAKCSELLTKLPNNFDGQFILARRKFEYESVPGFNSILYVLEKVKKPESYSHIEAILKELKIEYGLLSKTEWLVLLSAYFGKEALEQKLPDLVWEKDQISVGTDTARVMSLTELPQLTWKGCFQSVFEQDCDFVLSMRFQVPDRARIKRQLETKRRVSHALSITNSLEVQNIESNSVLSSSEETLERILVGKETLFEVSLGLIFLGDQKSTIIASRDVERAVSGIGNTGMFIEGIGTLPVFKSHLPGNKTLGIRKLPILSGNLAHVAPLMLDYTRLNDQSALQLRSRCHEVSHLNIFSKENLNYNAFICGASGSGKSFLMNAILSSTLQDEPDSRICIFDVGGSYSKLIRHNGGQTTTLSSTVARSLIKTFLDKYPIDMNEFFRTFLETLCGSGSHITHSHLVCLDELLKTFEGTTLSISKIIAEATSKPERFYQDVAHWLKPHSGLDQIKPDASLLQLIDAPVSSFDFKELDSDPILQKTSILMLCELLWRDLVTGRFSRTQIVFDEVWRFFSQSKGFLEEMYRTLRKYRAGIVSITQNLADYGDEAFAKMVFTNSFTKIFLQNGATREFLKNTFDLPESDIVRALSVTSKKPVYSEFFALTPNLSQVFRLYPTESFYALANTENIAIQNTKEGTKNEN